MTEKQAQQLDLIEKMIKDALFRLEHIEQYLEAGFLASNFQYTEQMGAVLDKKLKANPKDINVMGMLMRLDNDQQIIEPRMRVVNCAIWQRIVANHGNGKTLKYFEMTVPQPKSNLHVIGK